MIFEGQPAVIDYQGSLKGPITYDIVSLLKDCYVELPQEAYKTLLKRQFDQLQKMDRLDASMS